MLFDILALISILVFILLLRRLTNVFPALMACTIRWKESVNLEASVKQSIDRDVLAAGMILPFCLVADRFGLYSPPWMMSMGADLNLVLIIAIFLAYFLIRTAVFRMIHPRKLNPKTYKTAGRAAFTFFILLGLTLILMGGTLSFLKIDKEIIRSAMLCVSGFIYALFLLRKFQIFNSGCSFFTAFLYLCALEFFPTGVLVASAIIF